MQPQPQVNEAQTATPKTEPLTPGAAVKLKPLRDGLKELEHAYELMRAARAAYKEKIVTVAEKSGLDVSVVRAFVAARMADDVEKTDRKAEHAQQLAMVFDEVGV